ncbi:MAG: hypothetical protein LBH98_03885 [Chitinispirillales bacterium]|jgi:hypothetical protein|nr:hypothetical protein [Chitinispirillales bacterium]
MNLLLIFSSILLNSAAQLLIRKGMLTVGSISSSNALQSLVSMTTNLHLWAAMLSMK